MNNRSISTEPCSYMANGSYICIPNINKEGFSDVPNSCSKSTASSDKIFLLVESLTHKGKVLETNEFETDVIMQTSHPCSMSSIMRGNNWRYSALPTRYTLMKNGVPYTGPKKYKLKFIYSYEWTKPVITYTSREMPETPRMPEDVYLQSFVRWEYVNSLNKRKPFQYLQIQLIPV